MKRLDQNSRRSRAIIANGTIFFAGQVADDKSAGIEVQAQQAFTKIDKLLEEAGSSREKVVSITIWLKTMDDYDGFNKVWDAWVVQGSTPTRACAEVRMADEGYRVELLPVAIL
ncbi:RidA family protein [Burkholderia sp. MR1-5-21]